MVRCDMLQETKKYPLMDIIIRHYIIIPHSNDLVWDPENYDCQPIACSSRHLAAEQYYLINET